MRKRSVINEETLDICSPTFQRSCISNEGWRRRSAKAPLEWSSQNSVPLSVLTRDLA